MKVVVKMFAAAREAVGSEVVVEVPDRATVGDLRKIVCDSYSQVRPLFERAMFAVDSQYANDRGFIPENAEIACIPPVSGG